MYLGHYQPRKFIISRVRGLPFILNILWVRPRVLFRSRPRRNTRPISGEKKQVDLKKAMVLGHSVRHIFGYSMHPEFLQKFYSMLY